MSFYCRKNLVISTVGFNPLLASPTTNGEILVFDALLGSFVPPFTGSDLVEGINLGAGIPVLENQVNQDLYFNTLVPGHGITISEDAGEITIASNGSVIVVSSISDRDGLFGLEQGQLVFVQDTGQGEHAVYLWTGTSYITIATEDSAKTHAQTLVEELNFSSPSMTILGSISPTSRVINVTVDVTEAFNGSTPILTIGDETNGHDIVMTSNLNDLTVLGQYTMDESYLYGGELDETVKIYLDASDSTEGQVSVSISYV